MEIKRETESTIVAAQDQAISTNYFKNKILKEETESKCRLFISLLINSFLLTCLVTNQTANTRCSSNSHQTDGQYQIQLYQSPARRPIPDTALTVTSHTANNRYSSNSHQTDSQYQIQL